MKGIVLDYDGNTKEGIILGDNGNRYKFQFEDWKRENSKISLDVEVDFMISENKAIELYPINKTNLREENLIEEKKDFNFKKIDFDDIEKKINDPKIIDSEKKIYWKTIREKIKNLIVFWAVSSVLVAISFGYKLENLALFIVLMTFIFSVRNIFLLILYATTSSEKVELVSKFYGNELPIINYEPQSLNYDIIQIISTTSNVFDNARENIIRQAYDLKADAIINFTVVSATKGNVSSKLQTDYNLEGVAIRIK